MPVNNLTSLFSKREKPLILDGAVGSLLQTKGYIVKNSMWTSSANIDKPELVIQLHKEYINAGADIITTNTFRTNPAAVKGEIKDIKELVFKSVELVKEAAEGKKILIAGSNAPAEDCYQIERRISEKELFKNHQKHISFLIESGVDFILNETQSHLDEIKIISEFCYKEKIPYVLSIFLSSEDKILSGEKIVDVVKYLLDKDALAISFNCILPKVFNKVYKKLHLDYNWGFYLNLGSGNYGDTNIICDVEPEDYGTEIKKYLKKSPSFIGACCGSNPEHIKVLKRVLSEENN